MRCDICEGGAGAPRRWEGADVTTLATTRVSLGGLEICALPLLAETRGATTARRRVEKLLRGS